MRIKNIENKILRIRGQNVMLDSDLAKLYGVETKRLSEQVRRNIERFPDDFMFQLTEEETQELNRSQIATGSQRHRNIRYLPRVFTEHGALMLSSVLNSKQAIEVSIEVVRAFAYLRQVLSSHKKLADRIDKLDKQVAQLVTFCNNIARPKKTRAIGFRVR